MAKVIAWWNWNIGSINRVTMVDIDNKWGYIYNVGLVLPVDKSCNCPDKNFRFNGIGCKCGGT